ncbi:SGNH/GDSL hydrolase family protein [Arthrobacter sp. BB-1]|uniref:SGNH/GDSL hydrolase family protein n=1 Tax=unclassified Arthrobacter TaxID=235627 RepID=UPI001112352D|nr:MULTISPECIES: SGNH/GDSL hydrolase family protein [unclassified Arthrobacter]TNB70323.1 SGNH/GDSL hydrolase family protein [Arthrobacter sp. BB-1]
MGKSTLRRRLPAFAAGLASLAMATGIAAIPAEGAPPKVDYVALGDSYAAGQGAVPYTDPTCYVSRRGYPAIADKLPGLELTNATCSGQIVENVMLDVPSVADGTDLVTVTVGGNDVNTMGVLGACMPAPASQACAQSVAGAQEKLTDGSLAASLASLVATIQEKAPGAKVVLTGYPRLFAPDQPFAPVANPLADILNGVIAGVAANTGAQYVDVATAFDAHGIGSTDPWITFDPTNPTDPANFHPNGNGYRYGYYDSLRSQGAFRLN